MVACVFYVLSHTIEVYVVACYFYVLTLTIEAYLVACDFLFAKTYRGGFQKFVCATL